MVKSKERPYAKFGEYLEWLRTNNTQLSQTEAAEQLGLSRQQLNQYERGSRMPSNTLLIRLAHLYHTPTAEVLRKAYWPQLVLLPLVAIIDPEELSRELIEEIEKGLKEEERRQITEHVKDLLLKRIAVKQS